MKIIIDFKETRSIGDIYGFCDGNNVYINIGSPRVKLNNRFVMLQHFGRYCYYESIQVEIYNDENSSSQKVRLAHYAIEMMEGHTQEITVQRLKRILEKDPELYQEYRQLRRKKDYIKEYLIKYSKKHRDELDLLPPAEGDKLIALLPKNELDNSYESYYQRIMSYEAYPSVRKVELRESAYKNGIIRSIGLIMNHDRNEYNNCTSKVGTWRFFYENGQLKELVEYDLWEK